jgi:hypothetical protein
MNAKLSYVIAAIGLVSACGDDGVRQTGMVRGLWDGTAGVALHLRAGGVDRVFTLTTNGSFEVPDAVRAGTAYTLTVDHAPAEHTCVIDINASGAIGGDPIDVACQGPAVSITAKDHADWVFDPTQDTQTFLGSVIASDVVLTVAGPTLASAQVGGAPATLAAPQPAIPLAYGATQIAVQVTAQSGLTKTYALTFYRGSDIVQTVGGQAAAPPVFELANAMAFDGDTFVMVGPVSDQAVYVFVRVGSGWSQQAKIVSPGLPAQEQFGVAVALSGDTLVVGAPARAGGGGAYVFTRVGTAWSLATTLAGPTLNAQFGAAVAISGDHIAVGAPLDSNVGAVSTFHRDTGGQWHLEAVVRAEPPVDGQCFGAAVAIAGPTLAVGASAVCAPNGAPSGGDVEMFDAADAGQAGVTWSHAQTFTPPHHNTGFGSMVALSPTGVTVAIGVPGEPLTPGLIPTGAVYVATHALTWNDLKHVLASFPLEGESFGASVAVNGDVLAVGATGSVYLFTNVTIAPTQQSRTVPMLSGPNGGFGSTVGLSDNTLVVGAPGLGTFSVYQ